MCSAPAVGNSRSSPLAEDGRLAEGGQALPSRSECTGALTQAHLPTGVVGKVKGDDDHHTCVITSAIGLAYQTFTGPSISIFKPFPPKYTASWFLFSCSEI